MGLQRVRHDWATFTFSGFLGSSDGKASAYNVGDLGLIPGWGRSPGEGKGNPLQYSCLENPTAEEPGELQSMGSQRVRHDWMNSLHYSQTEAYILPTSGSVGNWRVCKQLLKLHHSWTLSPTQSYFLQFSLGYWSHKLSECKSPSQIGFPENLT